MTGRAEADRSCKGCRGDAMATEERIDRMLSQPMFRDGSDACVPDDVYEDRLRTCRSCPKLIGGHTCSLCGCFVRIRAKFKTKSCPAPGGAGWPPYASSDPHPELSEDHFLQPPE